MQKQNLKSQSNYSTLIHHNQRMLNNTGKNR